jgi:predicted type IV restriction endonuclease
VVLTPEEWVRQHVAHHFVNQLNYPTGRIGIEISLRVNTLSKRADMLVYSDAGKPLLLAECKASHIPITQATFDQVARYNITLGVPWLMVTNGLASYCCKIDHAKSVIDFVPALPDYMDLSTN